MRSFQDLVADRRLGIIATYLFCVLLPMGCTSRQAASERRCVSHKPALLADEVVRAYVSGVGGRVAEVAGFSNLSFDVLDSAVANAYAIPRGRIFITRGLLERMDNESHLAAVIGHESAHYKYGVGKFTAFGSSVEHRCDEMTVLWMVESGYDGREFMTVLEILHNANGEPNASGILDNHGAFEVRIRNIQRLSREKQRAEHTNDANHRTDYQQNVLQRLDCSR
jgi:predicted Zn-dependent protease